MSTIDIVVPSPGESVSEAQIASWLVNSGDVVEKDSEIAEVDSEKATLSIVAPATGTIEILAEKGQVVKIGAVIARINVSTSGEISVAKKSTTVDKNKEPLAETKIAVEDKAPVVENDTTLKMTPLARNVMHEAGLSENDLVQYMRTHRFGIADVKEVLNHQNNPSPIKSQTAAVRKLGENETMEPMSMLRRKLAARLVAVKNETAMLTTFNEADMSEINRIRAAYKEKFLKQHGVKLSMMSFFTMAVSVALSEFPQVSAQIHGDDILKFGYNDIGIAVSTPKGLMVPVIRGVQKMNLPDIEKAIAAMAEKARSGKIALDDLQGGTFTITNGGVFGSLLSTPILNPPQSAILGMHNIVERPVVKNGAIVAAPMMYLALSYDHRIIDGRESVGFLIRVKELVENPVALLSGNDSVEKLLEV